MLIADSSSHIFTTYDLRANRLNGAVPLHFKNILKFLMLTYRLILWKMTRDSTIKSGSNSKNRNFLKVVL